MSLRHERGADSHERGQCVGGVPGQTSGSGQDSHREASLYSGWGGGGLQLRCVHLVFSVRGYWKSLCSLFSLSCQFSFLPIWYENRGKNKSLPAWLAVFQQCRVRALRKSRKRRREFFPFFLSPVCNLPGLQLQNAIPVEKSERNLREQKRGAVCRRPPASRLPQPVACAGMTISSLLRLERGRRVFFASWGSFLHKECFVCVCCLVSCSVTIRLRRGDDKWPVGELECGLLTNGR